MGSRILAVLWNPPRPWGAPQWCVTLEWKAADAWVGLFWKHSTLPPLAELVAVDVLDVWVCVLPCLPIHVRYEVDHG